MQSPKPLTVSQAGVILGVDPSTIARWVDQGILRGFRTPGGHRRIPRAEVERLINEGRSGHTEATA